MQRHHLLPVQMLGRSGFSAMFGALGRERLAFDDFRSNGLLLPASEEGALVLGLPLHRGPHRAYNDMAIERMGQIEADWAKARPSGPELACMHASFRIGLLQAALRRRLLAPGGRPLRLNRNDPLGARVDFTALDAMAGELWNSTGVADRFAMDAV